MTIFILLQETAYKLSNIGPGSVIPIRCDVTKEDEILAMFEEINKKHGGVDVLVNNAGVSHDASFLSGKTEHWRNMLDVSKLE